MVLFEYKMLYLERNQPNPETLLFHSLIVIKRLNIIDFSKIMNFHSEIKFICYYYSKMF